MKIYTLLNSILMKIYTLLNSFYCVYILISNAGTLKTVIRHLQTAFGGQQMLFFITAEA